MNKQYEIYAKAINEYISKMKINTAPQILEESMLYTLKLPAKRLRGVLLLASYNLINKNWEEALPFAVAIEMIHAYSLIHDDLPAMDNDDMRRGKPSNHIVYGEDIAILTGDSLLNYAYETMLSEAINSNNSINCLKAIREIAIAAGVGGMIAGQVVDIKSDIDTINGSEILEYIHIHKTADLIQASVTAGLYLSGASFEQIEAGINYGRNIGLAFQIVDDILDQIGNEKELGKHVGKDYANNKLTWVWKYGIEASKEHIDILSDKACIAISSSFANSEFFIELAKLLVNRVK